jgi:hypothetical protein
MNARAYPPRSLAGVAAAGTAAVSGRAFSPRELAQAVSATATPAPFFLNPPARP